MSLHLEFEPHSWYMHFAIKDNRYETRTSYKKHFAQWEAFTDDGDTYRIVQLEGETLTELKQKIKAYQERYAEKMRLRYANSN